MIKDKIYPVSSGSFRFDSSVIFQKKTDILTEGLIMALDYSSLADFYRYKKNQFAAGEFWGKIMRASALLYRYSRDKRILDKMNVAVDDLLSLQGPDGEISTGPVSEQPNASGGADLWERKYVLLGLLGYYDVTGSLRARTAMIKLLDYTISQVGSEEGKTRITDTGWAFYGIESSSILEPVVRIYNISGDERHLQFAEYIASEGFCRKENVIEAICGGKSPRDIGSDGNPENSIAKAYEMMSCFEGLCELYRITGNKNYLDALEKFYGKLVKEEITYLGSGGADGPYNLGPGTGEQWNYTAYEQANPDIELSMETCVTVTWMKLCLQMYRLTGDSKYVDQTEISAYNALCGALRPDGLFFEYFPKFNGQRNPKVNFSYNVGGFDLSCCTANGPMGLAVIPQIALMKCEEGIVFNYFTQETYNDGLMQINTYSEFPRKGMFKAVVSGGLKYNGTLFFRIPFYASGYRVLINGINVETVESHKYPGYCEVSGPFRNNTEITIEFDVMDYIYVSAGSVNPLGNDRMLLRHGPVVLSLDKRISALDSKVKYTPDPHFTLTDCGPGELLNVKYDGISFIDYQSAGNTWTDDSEFRSWLS